MMNKLKIDRTDDKNETKFSLAGIIDEDARLTEAFTNLNPTVSIDLEGIELINSCGVREWIHALKAIPKSIHYTLDKCPPRIIEQVNYISNFKGEGRIASFYAPYFCVKCNKSENVLLDVKSIDAKSLKEAPPQKCPTCGTTMEFDDIEEEYFSFLTNGAS